MLKPTTAAFLALLAAGCASAPTDKTPPTTVGQLNSCMLREIYNRQETGKLPADEWTASQEVFRSCLRQLDLSERDVNPAQSLNIAASAIRALRQTSNR